MTDQTPELLSFAQYRRKQIAELRPFVPGEILYNVSISAEDHKAGSPKAGDMIARNPKNHKDQWLVAATYFADNFEAALTRPTPSDRPVAQVREALISRADQFFNTATGKREWASDILRDMTNYLRALTSERPSEAAVAWQWRACISGRWGAWLKVDEPIERFREKQAEHLRDGIFEVRPLYAIPREAVAWTEEERHAIAHARYQVEQASPEKPDCCFDFDLVKDLLRVIDRSIPHGDAVRVQATSIASATACDHLTTEKAALANAIAVIKTEPCPFRDGPMADAWAEAWATFLNRLGDINGTNELYANSSPADSIGQVIANQENLLGSEPESTLASERVSERETMTSVPAQSQPSKE